jgi:hypothetical protein
MECHVYASRKRPGTYVYLATRDDDARLPADLHQRLAPLDFVMTLVLTPERRLAQADITVVRANLAVLGYHLQFPPPP